MVFADKPATAEQLEIAIWCMIDEVPLALQLKGGANSSCEKKFNAPEKSCNC